MKTLAEQVQEIISKAQSRPPSPPASLTATPNTVTEHECDACQDQGYLGWKTPWAGYPPAECQFCGCSRGQAARAHWAAKAAETHQRELNRLFASAGIPAHFREMTVETMVERAGNDRDKRLAIDAVAQLAADGLVLDAGTQRYKPGIILSGDYGVGKTGLLTPVLRAAVEAGKSGLWIEVYDFISEIQAGYSTGDSNAKLEAAKRADVVLLDDLGDAARTAPETDDRRRIVYQLINHRHNEALPMLITTNCTAAQLAKQYGARTVERILESCAWVSMAGRNLRPI